MCEAYWAAGAHLEAALATFRDGLGADVVFDWVLPHLCPDLEVAIMPSGRTELAFSSAA